LLPTAKRTYYVEEEHGSLPNNSAVARAIDYDEVASAARRVAP
jgi:hypothetical protein